MSDKPQLPSHFEPPPAADRIARREMARALDHPHLAALRPIANGALAVGLGIYSLAYLFTIFSVVFLR